MAASRRGLASIHWIMSRMRHGEITIHIDMTMIMYAQTGNTSRHSDMYATGVSSM